MNMICILKAVKKVDTCIVTHMNGNTGMHITCSYAHEFYIFWYDRLEKLIVTYSCNVLFIVEFDFVHACYNHVTCTV